MAWRKRSMNSRGKALRLFSNIEPMLHTLTEAEVAEREVRSINYQMRTARFPAYRDLSNFDFNESPVDEALLSSLYRCDFVADAHNIVMIGGPGTGKTHLATAIGVQAITHHRLRVRFFSTIELVNTLEQEKAKGKTGQIANRLLQVDLVILDELGYLPFSQAGGALLFHLLSKLYERAEASAPDQMEQRTDPGRTFSAQYLRMQPDHLDVQ